MTMESRKRRWFKFHLSTALVGMLVAAGFMYLNFRKIEGVETAKSFPHNLSEAESFTPPPPGFTIRVVEQGFPMIWRSSEVDYLDQNTLFRSNLIIDAVLGFGTVLFSMVSTERIIAARSRCAEHPGA